MKSTMFLMALVALGTTCSVSLAFLCSPACERSDWGFAGRLSSLPADGRPVRVTLSASRMDAWSREPAVRVGEAFLRRNSNSVIALRATHHEKLRIPVVFDEASGFYRSASWKVAFDLEGNEVEQEGVPLIGDGLDLLEARVVGDDVWVRLKTAR